MRLKSRVQALERRANRSTICPSCEGRTYFALDDEDHFPDWLDGQTCRGCGSGVKLYLREDLDAL